MPTKILIASGSRHTIPPLNNSPGVAHVIHHLANSFTGKDVEVKVISKHHPALKDVTYHKGRFLHPPIKPTKEYFLRLLKQLPFSYRIFKRKYGFTQTDRILYYTGLVNLAKQQQPDVVVTFMHIQLFKMLKKALPHAKHVYFFRSTDLKYRLGENNIHFLLQNASGFLANTQAPLEELKQYGKVNFPMDTIYNAVLHPQRSSKQLQETREEQRQQYKIPKNALVLGFAGRFSQEKSLLELFESVAIINQQQPKTAVHIVLAGYINNEKIPNHAYFQALKKIEAESLQGHVHWLGWLPQKKLYQFYTMIDYGVVLSKKSEGNSMFLLECLSYGKPVVATAVGGNKEVIQSNYNGFLIQAEDLQEQLLQVLNSCLLNRHDYKVMSDQAINDIAKNHSPATMVNKFHAFLRKIK